MLFYHGAKGIVERPLYNFKSKNATLDYGPGFYLTPSLELAKEWAVSNNQNGYVSMYDIDFTDMKVLNLYDRDKYTPMHWLSILLQERYDLEDNEEYNPHYLEYIRKNFQVDCSWADMIVGNRADDKYFVIIEKFLKNNDSMHAMTLKMLAGAFGMQLFIKSEAAFEQFKREGNEAVFKGSIQVNAKEYNSLKRKRVIDANATEHGIDSSKHYDMDALLLHEIVKRKMTSEDLKTMGQIPDIPMEEISKYLAEIEKGMGHPFGNGYMRHEFDGSLVWTEDV